eukprot:PhF_6_TR41359/c0_g1_i2/m.62837/K20606/ANP1; mitogen-activated protein kinase kinase kinase ANP1
MFCKDLPYRVLVVCWISIFLDSIGILLLGYFVQTDWYRIGIMCATILTLLLSPMMKSVSPMVCAAQVYTIGNIWCTGGGQGYFGLMWICALCEDRMVALVTSPAAISLIVSSVISSCGYLAVVYLPSWYTPIHVWLCLIPYCTSKYCESMQRSRVEPYIDEQGDVPRRKVPALELNAVQHPESVTSPTTDPRTPADDTTPPSTKQAEDDSPVNTSPSPTLECNEALISFAKKATIQENEGSSPMDPSLKPAFLGGSLSITSPTQKLTLLQQRQQSFRVTKEKSAFTWKKGLEIGRGAYGTVSIALNEFTGELMAVKNILFDVSDKNLQHNLDVLQSELQMLRKLQHENIVRYYYSERASSNEVNIFMEYVPGGSIAQVLHQFGPLPETIIASYTEQILIALMYLHENHVVHRDIKCANVLLTTEGICKVADFGAAAQLDSIRSNKVMGTPLWMAPEVLQGKSFDWHADVWSLGCTVLEMLTAKYPFFYLGQNVRMTIAHIMQASTFAEVLQIGEIGRTVSPECADFLERCLQPNPNLRSSCQELLKHPFICPTEDFEQICFTQETEVALEEVSQSPKLRSPIKMPSDDCSFSAPCSPSMRRKSHRDSMFETQIREIAALRHEQNVVGLL